MKKKRFQKHFIWMFSYFLSVSFQSPLLPYDENFTQQHFAPFYIEGIKSNYSGMTRSIPLTQPHLLKEQHTKKTPTPFRTSPARNPQPESSRPPISQSQRILYAPDPSQCNTGDPPHFRIRQERRELYHSNPTTTQININLSI